MVVYYIYNVLVNFLKSVIFMVKLWDIFKQQQISNNPDETIEKPIEHTHFLVHHSTLSLL